MDIYNIENIYNQKHQKPSDNIENKILWKNIKSIKIRKILLYNFVEAINERNENIIVIQKNRLLLKSLCSNLKYIDDNNINLDSNKIKEIIGISINSDGLLCISKELYKEKKNTKIKNYFRKK